MIPEVLAAVTDRPHVLLPPEELAYWRTHTLPGLPKVFKGRGRYTVMGTRPSIRVMEEKHAPYHPTEVSSAWLALIFNAQRAARGISRTRVPWRKGDLEFLRFQQPEFFRGGRVSGELAYVDLKRSYFNLYRALSLDLRYCPDGPDTAVGLGRFRFLGHEQMADADKLALQSVSGMFRATRFSFYANGVERSVTGTGWNRYLSPGLWAIMSDTLHAVAGDAIDKFGACYWHTDGCALPAENAQPFIEHLEREWRLPATVKCSGPGVVTALGRWRIGEHQTVLGAARQGGPAHSNLYPVTDGRRRVLQRTREWTS